MRRRPLSDRKHHSQERHHPSWVRPVRVRNRTLRAVGIDSRAETQSRRTIGVQWQCLTNKGSRATRTVLAQRFCQLRLAVGRRPSGLGYLAMLAAFGSARSDVRHTASAVTVGELLHGYLNSAQLWKPATTASHRYVVSTLAGDPLCRCRLQSLTPAVVRAAICRWRDEGVSVPKVSARWLLIRSAVSWAVAEGLLRLNPLAGMRGPARPRPRRHHSLDEVRRLLIAAGDSLASAQDAFTRQPSSAACARRLFAAEQSLLLVRLAADCGARRGELAVLPLSDRNGRVLTIERSLSAGVLGPTKSGRTRRLTLGSGTADMIWRHVQAWAARVQPEQDWLFNPSPRRSAYLTADALSHRLTRLAPASGVEHPALHRLRHGLATYLDQGRPAGYTGALCRLRAVDR